MTYSHSQLSKFILESASSLLLEMQTDLVLVHDKACIVKSAQDVDSLFPPNLCLGKQDEKAFKLPQLFIDNKDTNKSLIDEYEHLANQIKKGTNFTMNDHFSKFLAMMTHKIGPDFKAFKRDFGHIILCLILELRVMHTYHPQLLKGAAGHFRNKLLEALVPLSKKSNTVVSGSKKFASLSRWEYPDIIDALPERHVKRKSAYKLQTGFDFKAQEMLDWDVIQKQIARIEKLPLAQLQKNETGTKKSQVAQEVSNALKELAKVRICRSILIYVNMQICFRLWT
jgi:hypothetical protein